MYLYTHLTLHDFIDALQISGGQRVLSLPLEDGLIAVCRREAEPYGLSLFRQAMREYEAEHHLPTAERKSSMPFFRQHQWRLVGPEWIPFVASFFESRLPFEGDGPMVRLVFDYEALTDYCIGENISLFRCKYDAAQAVTGWKKALAAEYGKVFFDEEHTGFAPDSRFVSLLLQAVLEVRPSEEAERKEWRMVAFRSPEEAEYAWQSGTLRPSTHLSLPADCLIRVEWPDYVHYPELYTALIGCMKQKGFVPERLLEGLIE